MYYETQRTLIEDLFARGARVVVAEDEASGRIQGWACFELKDNAPFVHYVLLRAGSESDGLVRSLIDAIPGDKPGFITHRLPYVQFKSWRWVPEAARRKSL